MKYVGLQSQIWKNNTNSIVLLALFPLVLYALTWVFLYFMGSGEEYDPVSIANHSFISLFPWVTAGVLTWFLIAWASHSSMIMNATGSRPLQRTENKRVYNLVENLCISAGMKMPKVNVIEDDSLNAFASGINNKSYTVSLSRGIINKLDDRELEGVIAHELTHIRNRDVRLLIISIIFVGIFAFLAEMFFRSMVYGGGGRKGKNGGAMLLGLALAIVGYLLSMIFRFAISRKREYLADAGAAEMTKNPLALASALRKVSQDARIEAVKRQDVAQMFIENPSEKKKSVSLVSLFATHPPIEKRIRILEQF
ncbi:MAG: M48 family metallopeptidase [Bacteroidales bacterium]|nr:M48 family metallopeptidase [Bacteroidales bacterium]